MKRYHNLILLALCLVGLSTSVCYDIFYVGKPDFDSGIESKIEAITNDAESIAHHWLQHADSTYINSCWRSEVSEQMRKGNVSLYLFENDSLLFWSNHLYQQDIDSIFTHTSGIQHWGAYEVLVNNQQQGDKRAVVITNLRLRGDVNKELFSDNDVEFVFDLTHIKADKIANIQSVNLPYCTFKVVMTNKYPTFWINFIGWLGFFAGLVVFKRWTRRGSTVHNALQRLALFTTAIILIRIFVYYVDIPHGGSYSFTSLGSLLVSQLFMMLIVEQAYHLRYKIRSQVERMKPAALYGALAVFTIFINVIIVYFHYAMVQTIYTYASVELYNILAVNPDTLFFYFIAAVFVALRIVYGRFFAITLRKIPFWIRLLISVTILMALVAPIENYIGDTGYILVLVHIVLMSVNCWADKSQRERIFIYNILIFAAYVTLFSAIESTNARRLMAEKYAIELSTGSHVNLSHDSDNILSPSSRLTYTIISEDEVTLKAGNKFNAQSLLPYFKITSDTIVRIDQSIHNIKRSRVDNSIVVVSYDKTTTMDIVSLFSYIFIWLFIVAGILLELSRIPTFKHYNIRSMLYRIRLIIFGVVIISLGVVCFVVYRYSGESYRAQQRQLLNTSVQSLIRSFNSFDGCPNKNGNQIMLTWYNTRGFILGYAVNLYDLKGVKIGGSKENYSASRLYDKAYQQLVILGLPYFDRYNSQQDYQITITYTPLTKNGLRVGYMSVVNLNRDSVVSRYSLLGNIFNIFIVIFLLSIVLSIGLYNIISKPLMVLSQAMDGVGKLQKIPITKDIDLHNEVGTLITQYNKMIDYLGESYIALARAEREGAWREMARQVAHEIKNPLTPMRLKIQMLQRARNNSPEIDMAQIDSTLDVLMTQIDILTNIATEFSDLARIPQGSSVRLDLCELLRSTIGLYSSNDCINISFEPRVLCGVFVEAEYAGLTRVLINLLQNATQAVCGYGTIIVRLWTENDYAIVEIEDSGTGISSDMMGRIFEPNFTTKATGSGLGLAISRQIIESASGHISARNGQAGAIFRIDLPLSN